MFSKTMVSKVIGRSLGLNGLVAMEKAQHVYAREMSRTIASSLLIVNGEL